MSLPHRLKYSAGRWSVRRRILAPLAVLLAAAGVGAGLSSPPLLAPAAADSTAIPPAAVTATGTAAAPATFVHPGILVTKPQLDFVKAKIAAGAQPWKAEYDLAKGSIPGRTTHVARPVPTLKCSTNPDRAASFGFPVAGCSEIIADSDAAYTQALLWYYSGDPAYAVNAKRILTAWATTMTAIAFDQPRYPDTNGQVYANGQLFGGWGGTKFLRAAEILRYTYSGWTAADTTLQENHYRTVYLPLMKDGWTGGQNRTTVMNETALSISIFLNDRTAYDYVMTQARYSVRSQMYLTSDGAQPLYPLYKGVLNYINTPAELKSAWSNPNSYRNGLVQETCRDLGHTMMAVSSLANMTEMARIQGENLYGAEQGRFLAAYELTAGYVLEYLGQTANRFNRSVPTGWRPVANWVCPSFAATGGGYAAATGWEIAYNHYQNRAGVSMPKTGQLITRIRAMTDKGTRYGNHVGWETLTHAGTP